MRNPGVANTRVAPCFGEAKKPAEVSRPPKERDRPYESACQYQGRRQRPWRKSVLVPAAGPCSGQEGTHLTPTRRIRANIGSGSSSWPRLQRFDQQEANMAAMFDFKN